MYSIAYSKQSLKDIQRLKSAKLDKQAKILISVI